jgi:acetyl esterase/lipase
VDLVTIETYRFDAAHYLDTDASTFGPRKGIPPSKWTASDVLVSTSLIKHFPRSWPKTLIMVGTADQLVDSSRNLVETMKISGIEATLVEFPHAVHLFWMFDLFVERNDLFQKFAEFLKG